jgi:ATP-dependent protease ClpP protease subunit
MALPPEATTGQPWARMAPPIAAAASTQPRQWYRIQAQTDSADEATVYVYGVIGGWWSGVDASEFVRELRGITAKQIRVHINSVGGGIHDGLAIFQALRNHSARIVTCVDALAASAASIVAMAGDEREVAPYGSVMVHKAWNWAVGNDDDMRKAADELAKVSQNMAKVYANRSTTDMTADEWLDIMTAETWYYADEAVEAGLMHRVQEDAEKTVDDDVESDAQALNTWGLNAFYAYAGRDKAPAPRIPGRPPVAQIDPEPENTDVSEVDDDPEDVPAAEPEPITEPKEEDPVSTLSTDVRSRLGLSDEDDDGAVLAALDTLKAKADTPAPDPTVKAQADAAVAENAELRKEVDVLASRMEQVTAELAQAKADKAAATKKTVFDLAIKAGKIKPADREQWEADYDEAPAAVARLLDRIAAGTAVPVSAAGETGAPEPDLDAEWEREMARLDGPTVTKGA